MKLRLSVLILNMLFMVAALPAKAEIEFLKVVEIQGKADIYDPRSSQWAQLTDLPAFLKSGFRLRTHVDSSAEIVLDHKWEKLIHLGASTRISVLDESLSRVALDEGQLYILCEEEKARPSVLKLLSKDARFDLLVAGVHLASQADGTQTQVFADFVTAFPKKDGKYSLSGITVQEGFQTLIDADAVEEKIPQRMSFDDYWKWQAWIKARYAQKDKLHSKRARA